MKTYNRENMQRAIGVLEGLRAAVNEKQDEALNSVIGVLDCVLFDEPAESEDTK